MRVKEKLLDKTELSFGHILVHFVLESNKSKFVYNIEKILKKKHIFWSYKFKKIRNVVQEREGASSDKLRTILNDFALYIAFSCSI